MNSKMQVDKLCLIKKIPQNTRSHCPFKPTTLCCLTLFLWYPPHALFPMMHLFSLCCGIYKGFDCIISGFPGRSGVVPCWLSSKRRENALFVLLKKKRNLKRKGNPTVQVILVCCVVLCAGIMRGSGIDEKARYWWLSLWRDVCLMVCVIMTNTALAAEWSVH